MEIVVEFPQIPRSLAKPKRTFLAYLGMIWVKIGPFWTYLAEKQGIFRSIWVKNSPFWPISGVLGLDLGHFGGSGPGFGPFLAYFGGPGPGFGPCCRFWA